MYISLSGTDLESGYRKIQQARAVLLSKWRFELLRAYLKRWDHYAQALARRDVRKRRFVKRYLPWIAASLLLSCIGAVWLSFDYFFYGSLLGITAVIGGIGSIVYWLGLSIKPQRPEHPIEQNSKKMYVSPLKKKLFPNLVSTWWHSMATSIPSGAEVWRMANQPDGRGRKNWGLIGEYNLIRYLDPMVSIDTFIMHSLQPKFGDDMDVVMIGPKGLWYFEVKYWRAYIGWHDGDWDIRPYNREGQGQKKTEMDEDPDAQWARMRDEALRNLRANGDYLLEQALILGRIKGGIVFAHPDAKFNIQKPVPFSWGTIGKWLNVYQAFPIQKEMTPEIILGATEILLKRHQYLNPKMRIYSMGDRAEKLLKKVEDGIQAWASSS